MSGTLGCRAGTCQQDPTGCVVDADCADATHEYFQWCNDEGSCSDQSSAGNPQIDPAKDAECLP